MVATRSPSVYVYCSVSICFLDYQIFYLSQKNIFYLMQFFPFSFLFTYNTTVQDILATVLTLSANQARTGKCGTTAMFTVLSRSGPVRSLQLATEMVWTGTTRFLQTAPCPYIYDFFPGIQPLPDPTSSLQDICGTNPTNDCLNYYSTSVQGRSPESYPGFIQTPGIEFMFTQAFATSYFRHVTGGCTPEGSQLIKPDFSNGKEVEDYQGTHDYALRYYCQGMVDEDYSCDLITLTDPINPWKSLNEVSARFWYSMPYMVPQSDEQLAAAISEKLPFDQVSNLNTRRYIEGLFCSVNPTGTLTVNDIMAEAAKGPVPLGTSPCRVSEDLLNKMCTEASLNEQGVVVTVNSGPFNDVLNGDTPQIPKPCVTGNEPYCNGATGTYPGCDHVVVLLDCDIEKDQYRFWTWANDLTLSREVLVANESTGLGGSLCTFMQGKPSGGDQPPFEPTPYEPGVCHLYCDIDDSSTEVSGSTSGVSIGSGMGSTSTAPTSNPDGTNGEVEGTEGTTSGSEASYVVTIACCIAFSLTSILLIAI